jgi:hypothetical protein
MGLTWAGFALDVQPKERLSSTAKTVGVFFAKNVIVRFTSFVQQKSAWSACFMHAMSSHVKQPLIASTVPLSLLLPL